jgi:hypothetical protein
MSILCFCKPNNNAELLGERNTQAAQLARAL